MTRINPGMPNLLVSHGREVFRRSDGQMVIGNNLILDLETYEQMLAGYRCARCMHVQSEPFPEQCEFEIHTVTEELGVVDWRCPMRIRDDQAAFMARELGVFEDFEPRDPYDVLDVERDDWKQTKTGIVVPRGVDGA